MLRADIPNAAAASRGEPQFTVVMANWSCATIGFVRSEMPDFLFRDGWIFGVLGLLIRTRLLSSDNFLRLWSWNVSRLWALRARQ